jgi:HSP20 family protein
MAQDTIHWLRTLFLHSADETARREWWEPSVDVYRSPRGWLVKCDLAGVRPEDLSLTLHGSRLTLRGTRRDWCLEEGCHHYRMEISYSRFERTVELPEEIGQARVTTEFRDGMLLVRLQKEAPQ